MSEDRSAILARRRRFLIVALAGVGCTTPTPVASPTKPVPTTPQPAPKPDPKPEPPSVDTDADGVPDAEDRCPTVAGTATPRDHDDLGCPPRPCLMIVAPQEIVVTQQIAFPLNGTKLSPSAYPLLDEIRQILESRPELTLEIQGHTQTGERDPIATARAKSVQAYLAKKGVAEDRMTIQSYGDTKPFYAEKEKNRRVSFALREK